MLCASVVVDPHKLSSEQPLKHDSNLEMKNNTGEELEFMYILYLWSVEYERKNCIKQGN
jgi:hypothetical protein